MLQAGFPIVSQGLPEAGKATDAISATAAVAIGRHDSFTKMGGDSGLSKRFFIAGAGSMGMGPEGIREGYITAILFGGALPFVLRPVENGFRIIGSCYFHWIINGELVSNFEKVGMLDLSGHLIKWESEFEG